MIDLRNSRTHLFHARDQLRAKLSRLGPERPAFEDSREILLEDEAMLSLLEHVAITPDADETLARARYEVESQAEKEPSSFGELIKSGWFQILLGRLVTTVDISLAAGRGTQLSPALAALIRGRFDVQYDFAPVPRGDPELDDVVGRLENGGLRLSDLSCRRPWWVAARLWERKPLDGDPLRWWLERWELLGRPPFTPLAVWDQATTSAFHDCVLDRLEREPALASSPEFRQAIADQEARGRGETGPSAARSLPDLPETLVGRARWLGDVRLERSIQLRDDAFEEVRHLVGLLLADAEQQRHVPAPNPLMRRLVDLAADRPDVLQILVGDLLRTPSLVAELLVIPKACALGCLILTLGPLLRRNREPEDPSFQALEQAALRDGLEMLARFLLQEQDAAPYEAATLLQSAYEQKLRAHRIYGGLETAELIVQLLAELDTAVAPIIGQLAATGVPETLDDPAFLAGIELAAAAGVADQIDPDPLCGAFIGSITQGHFNLSADLLSPAGAATLFRLAERCGPARLVRFLHPIEIREELKGLSPDDLESRGRLTRAIAVTTRVLALAVEHLGREAPDGLIEALAAHVSAGSGDEESAGKIFAFRGDVQRPERSPSARPIGILLGAALSALDQGRRSSLLAACLELDEPAMLARIYRAAPLECRAQIADRIEALPIDEARPVSSLATIHARVEALLDAGLSGPASDYISAEKQQGTRGKIPERARIQLGHELRLNLLTGDAAAIRAARMPEGLPQTEREACRRMLDHFQALAALQDDGFDPAFAVERLERLATEYPLEPAHQVNLFAARIAEALGQQNFALLPQPKQTIAKRLAAEVEQWMRDRPDASDEDRQTCSANLAILDLALGQPQRALGRLLALPAETETAPRAAHLAITQARLGHGDQAHAMLDAASKRYGPTRLLEAARQHVAGTPSSGGLGLGERVILATPLEDLRRLQYVLGLLPRRAAPEQATILRGSPERLSSFIADEVDDALAAISALAPLLNRGVLPDDEDDVSALLKPLLNARLGYLGWATSDQSKGGYTPSGNYGERDIILVQGNRELAVMEAVIASGSIPHSQLTTHFRKLLGYGDCALYFHLTYAWLGNMDPLLAALEGIARTEAPDGYAFEGIEPRVRAGNGSRGFTARYRVAGQVIEVVFFILDLGQHRLRDAATASSQKVRKPRRKPRSPAKSS